jgi:hypothetical protein
MKPFIIENPSTTTSFVVTKDILGGEPSGLDLILRMKSDKQSQTFQVVVTNTQTVRDDLSAFSYRYYQDLRLLSSVILWQKKIIDYQALYTAFLLNSLSEDEFELESEKFIVHQKDVLPEKIASDIERLDSLIGIKFDTSDYADYFQCSQQNVMAGLRLIPTPHFAAMLPSAEEVE